MGQAAGVGQPGDPLLVDVAAASQAHLRDAPVVLPEPVRGIGELVEPGDAGGQPAARPEQQRRADVQVQLVRRLAHERDVDPVEVLVADPDAPRRPGRRPLDVTHAAVRVRKPGQVDELVRLVGLPHPAGHRRAVRRGPVVSRPPCPDDLPEGGRQGAPPLGVRGGEPRRAGEQLAHGVRLQCHGQVDHVRGAVVEDAAQGVVVGPLEDAGQPRQQQ
ncbi:hypothetical protein [Planotetraspora kaengkrachanensis]|uniref:Uncharacterized protein n=1 Tax=Planotetraspora kaengkrachanensis TaxID=575193 RepID=A0A8J3VBT8_9ACTN|nr:hypothetical protein [Planotetraspora kaengkrachanensis]GIG83879.1 hypothetical protein Pka01_70060 [Planotetraspora kaengkrachanensis]